MFLFPYGSVSEGLSYINLGCLYLRQRGSFFPQIKLLCLSFSHRTLVLIKPFYEMKRQLVTQAAGQDSLNSASSIGSHTGAHALTGVHQSGPSYPITSQFTAVITLLCVNQGFFYLLVIAAASHTCTRKHLDHRPVRELKYIKQRAQNI